jgi:hypothetical protein
MTSRAVIAKGKGMVALQGWGTGDTEASIEKQRATIAGHRQGDQLQAEELNRSSDAPVAFRSRRI